MDPHSRDDDRIAGKIKCLVWETQFVGAMVATTAFGKYTIFKNSRGYRLTLERKEIGIRKSLDDTKMLAQRDSDHRVRLMIA